MKLFLILFLNFLAITSFSQSDYEWEKYENPLMITKDNASIIDSFENTPESIVTYFYASKIRQDNKWKKVLPNKENRSERLKKKLNIYENWVITQFKLVSKTNYSENKLWIKVFFAIEYEGKTDSGTDEVSVEFVNGKWLIISVPT